MNNDSVTGSSGSSYISHRSYQYTIDIPHPTTIAYGIDTPPNYGYFSHGHFIHFIKLVILQALQNHPENIWIDKPSQLYLEAIKNDRKHCYS
jgi:hypothetical protein